MKYISITNSAQSGSVAGCTYSRNRYGQYARSRAIPVNPASAFQNATRATFAALAQAWVTELTDAQRAAWDTYAANVPKIDSLGRSIFVLGLNWYIGINTLRAVGLQTRLDTAPILFTGTSLTLPTLTLTNPATDEIEIGYTNTDEWAGAVGGRLHVFTGGPTNETRNFFGGPFRYVTDAIGAVVPPTSPLLTTSAQPYSAGQKLWARLIAQAADGRLSFPVIINAVV